MITRLFAAFLVFLSSYSSNAQNELIIDSLISIIEQDAHDTLVCEAYSSWGEQLYLSNPDTALTLFLVSRDIAESNLPDWKIWIKSASPTDSPQDEPTPLQRKHLSFLADALNNIGVMYQSRGDVQDGLDFFHESLEIREILDDQHGRAYSLNNLGTIYYNQGDIERALENYHMSLKIREAINDKEGVANSFGNIGIIYDRQGDLERAMEYYQKSFDIYDELGDKNGAAIALNNIGAIYSKRGDVEKQAKFYGRSLILYEETGNKKGIAYALHNIGTSYKQGGETEKALDFYIRSLDIWKELGDKQGVAFSSINIGEIYLKQGDTQKAEEAIQIGYNLARKLGFPENIRDGAKVYSEILRSQGNFEQALEMYEEYIVMADSIKNEETQKASIRQETKYEFEKAMLVKEQQKKEEERLIAQEISRRDNLQYSVIFIAILVLFGGVLALGFINVSEKMAEGIIFFSFLILFEFLLVLADPYIDRWSGGAPGIKLLFNAGIAALIFPAHAFFESKLKGRLVKSQ